MTTFVDIKNDDYTPTVETAIELLDSLCSNNDPVSIPIRNTNGRILQWIELANGIEEIQGGGLQHIPTKRCEQCFRVQCPAVIDTRGDSRDFKIKFASVTRNKWVSGTLFDMVLDRMGCTKHRRRK